MFEVILLYALFSASFPMGKALLCYMSPVFLTGVRMTIGGGVLLSYLCFWNNKDFIFNRKHWWLFAQVTVLGIFLTYTLRFWALRDMASAKTCFFYNLSPFFSSLFSYIIFKEKMSSKKWLGLTIGFIGMIPMLLNSSSTEQVLGEWFFISLPELVVMISVACHSYSWIVLRRLVRDEDYSPMMVNGFSMFFGGILALIASFIPFIHNAVEAAPRLTDIGPVIKILPVSILISNIICYNMYGHLLKKYTATFVAFAGFSGPIFAAIYGWFFLSETITWHFVASSIILFGALYLFYQEELRTEKIKKIKTDIPNPILED